MPFIPDARVDRFVSERTRDALERVSDKLIDRIMECIPNIPFLKSFIRGRLDDFIPEGLYPLIDEGLLKLSKEEQQ